MKTAIALLAAALSVAALSTNASAQLPAGCTGLKKCQHDHYNAQAETLTRMRELAAIPTNGNAGLVGKPSAIVSAPSDTGATSYMTGSAGATGWREVNGLPSPATFLTGGADTSFGTRSGGGFKLASETDEANPNDSPGPKPEKIMRPTTGLLFASFLGGSAGPGGDDIYTSAKIGGSADPGGDDIYTSAKIGGSASPGGDDAYALIASLIGIAVTGGETDEYGDPIASEAEAARTFDYCVIYPERCTFSQIERPTFGPHMVTFDNVAGSAGPGGDDI